MILNVNVLIGKGLLIPVKPYFVQALTVAIYLCARVHGSSASEESKLIIIMTAVLSCGIGRSSLNCLNTSQLSVQDNV